MDLDVAAEKYALGLLGGEHLAVIASEALGAGHYSDALAEVALEREPVLSSVGPMFEQALRDLGVTASESRSTRFITTGTAPVSVRDSGFREVAAEVLARDGELFVLHRIAYAAGAGAGWYHFADETSFIGFLESPQVIDRYTAVTIVLRSPILARGTPSPNLASTAESIYQRYGDLSVISRCRDTASLVLRIIEFGGQCGKRRQFSKDAQRDHQAALEQARQEVLAVSSGAVFLARSDEWWGACQTAYTPNENGVPVVGCY